MSRKTYRQAIGEALRQEMRRDPNVIVMGIDVGGGQGGSGAPLVEFTALGTAIAPLAPGDPRRAQKLPTPTLVVPLDR